MYRKAFFLVCFALRLQAAESDALAISANIQARHLPYGTVIDPIFAAPDSDQVVGYTRCGDSAIWTGHYLAAEAFRYKVTQSTDALSNVRKGIAGIKSLVDVTGNGLLARCLVLSDSPFAAGIRNEEAKNGVFTAAPWIWVGNTSRDQYAGVIFGLAVAYDMVDDPAIKDSISQLVTRIVDYPRGHDWTVPLPDRGNNLDLLRPDFITTLLQVGKHVNPSHYSSQTIREDVLLAPPFDISIKVEVQSDDSYFKFNLDYINLYNLLRLDPSSKDERSAYNALRQHTATHQNAFFDVIDRALNGPDAARDAEAQSLLDAWLQRPRRDKIVDLHGVVPVCGDQACQPVPVPMRPPTDFIWQRNPFQLAGGLFGTVETAGIDYILPYWMGRFYGLGSASSFTIQSAAAAGTTVAPESIASIFGSNLAGQTQSASALPLPTSLGGISLAVKDAAGTQRPAPLIYVSPGQINFIVPQSTAPGSATFTITNGGSTLSATGNVQNIAPTLFSMNGKGTGVAAATAVRTQAPNPVSLSPVAVFQCDSAGANCVSVPIDLGVDTPVYLTLYGTGIRSRSSLANVTATINGTSVPVLYAGPQPSFAGLDQVNVPLTLNLRGSGEANVVVTVDGQTANTVTVNIR